MGGKGKSGNWWDKVGKGQEVMQGTRGKRKGPGVWGKGKTREQGKQGEGRKGRWLKSAASVHACPSQGWSF